MDQQVFRLPGGIEVSAPATAKPLIREIWSEQCYLRNVELEPESIVVDIGANVGIFSLLAASKGARVYSFEPNPESFSLLARNIAANRFEDRIFPFNKAVSGKDGSLELAIPESAKIYSLGSATTSKAIRTQIEQEQRIPTRRIEVHCVSMGTILDEIIGQGAHVNLLKMDCEGAEWDILSSTQGRHAARISHFSMETHIGYREKDLARLLQALGFRIDEVRPRGGVFQTGYFYGSRQGIPHSDERQRNAIVPILSSPQYAFVSEQVVFGAEDSFSIEDPDRELKYRWEIEGMPSGNQERYVAAFQRKGIASIRLKVMAGSQEASVSKELLVSDHSLSDSEWENLDLPSGAKRNFRLQGVSNLRILPEAFPSDWDISNITLAILSPIQFPPDLSGIELHFGGSASEIKPGYQEINLRLPTTALGCNFTLIAKGEAEIDLQISWWPAANGDQIQPEGHSADMGDGTLPKLGSPLYLVFEGERTFSIPQSHLPTEWVPRRLKVGISSVSDKGEAKVLRGHFERKGEKQNLEGYYSEFALADYDSTGGNDFALFMPEATNLKIAWWGE